ncbi:MAG TPA: hypothetical protein PLA71_00055 [Saccharofermentans sp.]|nr:hypothetical protein [Saccharofermentans sp.]
MNDSDELNKIKKLVNAKQFKYWDGWKNFSTAKKVKIIIGVLNRVSKNAAKLEQLSYDIHYMIHSESINRKA